MKNILIIGSGESEIYRGKAVKFNNTLEVIRAYGVNSDLAIAFEEAYTLGVRNIYLFNAFYQSDYIVALSSMTLMEFEYVVPLVDISEKYMSFDSDAPSLLAELYCTSTQENFSRVIYTSKHAKDFEDLEHYINDTRKRIETFKSEMKARMNGENLYFVANTIKNYKFANVALAATLVKSNFTEYPKCYVGETIFDLHESDFGDNEIIFFNYDESTGSTVENLYNFYNKNVPEKYIPTSIIINIVDKKLNLDEYRGAMYTAYTKVSISNKANALLNELTGSILERYEITSTNVYRDTKTKEISIVLNISLKLFTTIEEIRVTRKV